MAGTGSGGVSRGGPTHQDLHLPVLAGVGRVFILLAPAPPHLTLDHVLDLRGQSRSRPRGQGWPPAPLRRLPTSRRRKPCTVMMTKPWTELKTAKRTWKRMERRSVMASTADIQVSASRGRTTQELHSDALAQGERGRGEPAGLGCPGSAPPSLAAAPPSLAPRPTSMAGAVSPSCPLFLVSPSRAGWERRAEGTCGFQPSPSGVSLSPHSHSVLGEGTRGHRHRPTATRTAERGFSFSLFFFFFFF